MTDIEPNVPAWQGWCKKSESGKLDYVEEKVDATGAPGRSVLLGEDKSMNGHGKQKKGKKIMRLFSLAFHHFDDDMARRVLKDAVETGDGFCIFELQARNFLSFIMVSLLWPLAIVILAPIYFYNSPGRLVFTYLVPCVPFVWVFDGYISCLRTRTPAEVRTLMREAVGEDKLRDWIIRSGQETHTVPIGKLRWFMATKDDR
ncbi:uncharacterized protein AB675_8972 [Cyphellophora attinorum]|uniref:Uncharacterized protein n=1 Tax=Cyphellophora attinorum TaxID=1664694 RepID=A0A0N0NJ38_9EURO|nr:uncharacterized protein AB675_8972 [Phialophora attinorum]KPI36159.1 hypothetical protein AB675_8972 [Phialophora attinorum]